MPRELLDWLIERYPTAKRQTLKRMVQSRRVAVNGVPARSLKDELSAADAVIVDEHPAQRPEAPPQLPFEAVFEDSDILVIDKPIGLLTSTVPREKRPTALAMVRAYLADSEPSARIGLIHRLDRDASGLLIFSKNRNAYESLKRQFFNHGVRRVYAALVHGAPTPAGGRIESRLIERADGTVRSTSEHARGQRAITDYETIDRAGTTTSLRVTLLTGRKHQIRVHLSERGVPIVNDPVYGTARPTGRLMLAAIELEITHPRTSKRMHFTLATPWTVDHSTNIASPKLKKR